MFQLTFDHKIERFIARCQDCSYHSPKWRNTNDEAAQDGMNHVSKPENEDHLVNIYEEITNVSTLR